ncbi:MAG: hypothetical protein ABI838_08445 [Chloroflexota bacterium]
MIWAATVVVFVADLFTVTRPEAWTPITMAAHHSGWLIYSTLQVFGALASLVPMILIAAALRATSGRGLAWAALVFNALALALLGVWIALRFSMASITEGTLGDLTTFQIAVGPLAAAIHVATMLGFAALGLCLWQTRRARWTGLVVAVLSLLLIPLVFGQDHGPPVFLYSLLWLPVGLALLWNQRKAALKPTAV